MLTQIVKMRRVPYVCNKAQYHDHFCNQLGSGEIFKGSYIQQGYGLGGLLASAFRSSLPLMKKLGKAVVAEGANIAGEEIAKSGIKVLKDVAIDRKNMKSSLRTRGKEGFSSMVDRAVHPTFRESVKNRQQGKGIRKRRGQTLTKKDIKRLKRDIFD